MSVICHIEFIDKLKNKRKNVTNDDYYVIWKAKRREMASNNRYKMNRVNKLIVIIEGEVNKFVINSYLNMKTTMLWREFFYEYC